MKEQVQPGKYVLLTYAISDENGTVVEQNDIPVGYIFGGETELLGGMDAVLIGKVAGEEISSQIPPEKGFGKADPQLIFSDDIENVPSQYQKVGAQVQMQNDEGETKTFYVSKIQDGIVTVDGNHPLAGKTVTLKVTIVEVRDATKEDLIKSNQNTNSPTLN